MTVGTFTTVIVSMCLIVFKLVNILMKLELIHILTKLDESYDCSFMNGIISQFFHTFVLVSYERDS